MAAVTRSFVVILASMAVIHAWPAGAAEPLPEQGSDADLAEVVVNAEKVPQTLQRTTLSVLVLTSNSLERAGVQDFDDLPQIAPSLTFTKTSQPANNSINIRGIGTYAFSIAVEPSVAVVIDDIPLAFQASAFTSLVDVQQVEVLRGPQSTLFGKASSAGVVRVTTAAVTPEFSGRLRMLQTDDHEQRVQGSISGPITPQLGYRLSGNYSDYRGDLYNLATKHWVNGQADGNLRGKLEWLPAVGWKVDTTAFWTTTDGTCCTAAETFVAPGSTTGSPATGLSRISSASFLQGISPVAENRLVRMDVDPQGDSHHGGAGLRIERRGGSLTFLSLSSYEKYSLTDLQDTDSTDIDFSQYQPVSPTGGSANGGLFHVISRTQEFRVNTSEEARAQFVLGTFWSSISSVRDFVRGSNSLDDYSRSTPPGQLSLPISPRTLPTTNDSTFASYFAKANSENLAAFAQGTYALGWDVDLLAGARWSREKISYSFHDRGNEVQFGGAHCESATPSGIAIQTCNQDDVVTGRVGLRLQQTKNLMLFATFSRGYKGLAYDLSSSLTLRGPAPVTSPHAGLPLADAIAANQPVPAESVDSYEIGFKSTLLNDGLILNATAYRMVFANFQAQSRDLLLGQNVLNSIGRVTSGGVEVELVAQARGVSFTTAAAYNRALINVFPTASCYRGQTVNEGCVAGVQDLSGKTLPNAPEWNFSVQSQYEAPLNQFYSAVWAATYHWQSTVNYSLLQDPASRQAGYGALNLTAGLQAAAWRVSAFLNNVFDQQFQFNGGRETYINNPVGAFATNWRPARESQRTAGISLAYDF